MEEYAGKDVRQEEHLSALSAFDGFFGAWEITHGKSPAAPSNPYSSKQEDASQGRSSVVSGKLRGMSASMGTASTCLGFQTGVRDFRRDAGTWSMMDSKNIDTQNIPSNHDYYLKIIDRYSFIVPGIVIFIILCPYSLWRYDTIITRFYRTSAIPMVLAPFIAYFTCPCSCGREITKVFSWGSLGAALGFIIGIPLCFPLYIIFKIDSFWEDTKGVIVVVTISSMFLSWYFQNLYHRHRQRIRKQLLRSISHVGFYSLI